MSGEPRERDGRGPVVLVVGMAGSGKTTFLQRLQANLTVSGRQPYVINLDPAVLDTPYEPNLDIRDTVDYASVMKQYGLGPNGAILTCLNLYATKWDQVLELLEKRLGPGAAQDAMAVVDTPGQIEIFTWSASGAVISESTASTFPTVIAYVVDTPRCSESPVTFMSNMLYACSIMYKSQLPLVLVFNKTDLESSERAMGWLKDYYAFQEALEAAAAREEASGKTAYLAPMMQSMGLVLDEFYANIRAVSVSAFTGDGIESFEEALGEAVKEYATEYLEELRNKRQQEGDKLAKDMEGLGVSKDGDH